MKLKWDVGKVLEVLGMALVLGSFILQSFVYDAWTERSLSIHQAILEQAIIEKSVLLNESLFYIVSSGPNGMSPNEVYTSQVGYLKEAARKQYAAVGVNLKASERMEGEHDAYIQDIEKRYLRVNNLIDYNSFRTYVTAVLDTTEMPGSIYKEIEKKRGHVRGIFLGVGALGSVLLILGVILRSECNFEEGSLKKYFSKKSRAKA